MDAFLPVPAADQVFAAAADAALKSALLLAVAALAAALLHRRSAALRHRVWTLALAGALALPLFAVLLPAWHVPLPALGPADEAAAPYTPPLPAAPAAAAAQTRATELRAPAALLPPLALPTEGPARSASPSPEPLPRAPRMETPPRAAVKASAEPAPAPPLEQPEAAAAPRTETGRVHWLLLAWAGGASLVFAYFFAGMLRAEHLVQQARPVTDARWQALAAEAARQIGIDRRVQLRYTAHAAAPMVWGLFGQAVVLLPEAASAWDEPQRRAVLLHELAHLQRRDCATQLLGQMACALYWFNPLAWWAARQMRVERERACDDRVLGQHVSASTYAEHLVAVARSLRAAARPPAGALTMARPSGLEDRIARILDPSLRRAALSARAAAGLGLAVAALVGVLAAVQPRLGLAEAAAPPTARAAADSLRTEGREVRWTGTLAEGATLEVKNISGSIRAEAASGREAEVVVRRTGADWRAVEVRRVARPDGGVLLCAVFPGQNDGSDACDWNGNGSNSNRNTDASAAFTVRVPEGVRFEAGTISGNVQADGLSAEAHARTVSGNIALATAGHASGQTVSGNVEIEMGRADWPGTLALETVSGNLAVTLPASADTEVEAQTMNGEITSAFPLDADDERFVGAEASGTLGSGGGRTLRLQTVSGSIRLRSAGGTTGEIFRYQRTGRSARGLTPPPPPMPPVSGPRVIFRTDTSLNADRERVQEAAERLNTLRAELAERRAKFEDSDDPEERARLEALEQGLRAARQRLEEARQRLILQEYSPAATDSSMKDWEAYWDEHANDWARYGEAMGQRAEEWAERWSEEWSEDWAESWGDGNAHGFVFRTGNHAPDSLRQPLRALRALSRLPDEESVPRLIEIARTHPSERIREEAVEALARKEAPAATRFLEEVLRDENAPARVQEEALEALYRQRGAESIPVLIEVARTSPHPEVRAEAIDHLGRSGDPRAADALADLVRAQ